MHWIQRHILEQLSFVARLRNRDLRPDGVESNLFQYHLNQVVRNGYVKKIDAQYELAAKGLSWADGYSTQLKKVRPQPKIVTMLGVYNRAGEYLLIPKQLQPYVGQLYIPSGKMRIGEPVEQAAHRELQEKLGMRTPDLRYVDTIRVCIRKGDTIITDYVGFVFTAALPSGHSLPAGARWYSPDQACSQSVMPATDEVLRCLSGTGAVRDIFITKP